MKFFTLIFLSSFIFTVLASTFPHIVWLYWDQGQSNLNDFGKACFSIMKSLHQNTSWDVRLVDKNSIKQWLDQKDFKELEQIFQGKTHLQIQSKVDFYRLFLIYKYGGVWLDIGIILHENLDWLQNLTDNPYVINKEMATQPQIFYFYTNRKNDIAKSIKYQGKTIYANIDIENFMFAAIKQSRYIKDLIAEFKKLVLKGNLEYIKQAQNYNLPFQYKPYYAAYLANDIIQYRLAKSFHEIQKQEKHFPIQNFYHIWGINRFIGPYHQGQFKYIQSLFQNQPRRGDHARYLTKIHHFGPQQFMNDMLSGLPQKIQKKTQSIDNFTYTLGKKYFPFNLRCLYQYRINENSVINKYFLSRLNRQQFYPNAIVVKKNQLPFICQITSLNELKYFIEAIWKWTQYSFWIFLFTQLFIQYLSLFKLSQKVETYFNLNKDQLKISVFQKLLLIIVIQSQIVLIHSQYELWTLQSPTALFVGIIHICALYQAIKNLLHSQTKLYSKKINFFLFIAILMIIQYIAAYELTVWKYEGVIYNFQTLRQVNLQKLKYLQRQIIKIFVLIFLFQILRKIKQLLKLDFLIEKKKQYKNIQSVQVQEFDVLYQT